MRVTDLFFVLTLLLLAPLSGCISSGDNGEAIGISFGITSSSTGVGASILHERDSSGSQGSLQFYTNGDGSNVAERMRIASSGNVGIGITNPTSTLHISGDVRTTNRLGSLRSLFFCFTLIFISCFAINKAESFQDSIIFNK